MSAHNKAHYIEELVRQLRDTAPRAHLVLIDDGSSDGTGDILRRHADVFLRTEDVWEVLANNAGLRATSADYVALVQDDDFFLVSGWLETCAGVMAARNIDVLGGRFSGFQYFAPTDGVARGKVTYVLNESCRICFQDEALAGGASDADAVIMRAEYYSVSTSKCVGDVLDSPPAPVVACDTTVRSPLILSRRAMNRLGLLDEAFAPLTYDDHDFCLRARAAGLTVAFTTVPQLIRYGGGSADLYQAPEKQAFFRTAITRNLARLLDKHGDYIRTLREPPRLQILGTVQFGGCLTPAAQAALRKER